MLKFFLIFTLALLATWPARAVIVLDRTWEQNGGSRQNWDAGFDAHFALAARAQFASIIGLWDGTQYGGSGVWIGNDTAGHAYVLTAAHNFGKGDDASAWVYYSRDETEFQGLNLWIHPKYDPKDDTSGGWDMAIVQLDGEIHGAGPAPLIYSGRDELGAVVTITGYGARGIGTQGEADKFYNQQIAAAARNVIDEVNGENGPNLLVVDFDSDAGDANRLTGDATPVDKYEGILGSGDSGGATWMKTDAGWAIVGVNAWGDEPAQYGSISAMARVSTQRAWIKSVFPGARFTD